MKQVHIELYSTLDTNVHVPEGFRFGDSCHSHPILLGVKEWSDIAGVWRRCCGRPRCPRHRWWRRRTLRFRTTIHFFVQQQYVQRHEAFHTELRLMEKGLQVLLTHHDMYGTVLCF